MPSQSCGQPHFHHTPLTPLTPSHHPYLGCRVMRSGQLHDACSAMGGSLVASPTHHVAITSDHFSKSGPSILAKVYINTFTYGAQFTGNLAPWNFTRLQPTTSRMSLIVWHSCYLLSSATTRGSRSSPDDLTGTRSMPCTSWTLEGTSTMTL